MPGKRTSVGGKIAVSPAKKQRVAADPLLEACKPVFKVLKSAGGVTADDDGSAAELLCAALPGALRAEEGTQVRHAYQEKMLDAVNTELSNIVTSRKDSVTGIEAQVATLEDEKAQSTTIQDEMTSRLAEKTKIMNDAGEATSKQQSAVTEAQASLASAKEKAAAADEEKQTMEKVRDDFVNGLTELWEPLKASNLQWRQRDKKLAKLAEKMQVSGAEPSLLAALPVALKIKAESRPEFAQATVAHAEDIYMKHVEVLKAKVDNFRGAQDSASATADAESCAKAAQEAFDAAMSADIDAQNAWAEVASEDKEHKDKMKAFAPTAAKLEKQLEHAKAQVAHIQGVFDSFQAIRPVSAVLKKMSGTEEAPPAEEAPPVEEAQAEAA